MLIELLAMPMLSTTDPISSAGTVSRMASSILPNSTEASSSRVPTGARTCRVIWPESTEGKKLPPRNGASPNETSTAAMKPTTNTRRWLSAMASRLR